MDNVKSLKHCVGLAMLTLSSIATANELDITPPHRMFKVELGRGVDVCDAYVDALNSETYESVPFCKKYNFDSRKGFESLGGRPGGVVEVTALYDRVHQFMYHGDQYHPARVYHGNFDHPELSYDDSHYVTQPEVTGLFTSGVLSVWIFDTPVDFNNDGRGAPAVIWRGLGASNELARCGALVAAQKLDAVYVAQRAFILSNDERQIDEQQTRAVFGSRSTSTRNAIQSAVIANTHPFNPMAASIDFFKFRGKTYISGENVPSSKKDDERIRIYLRENQIVTNACTFRYTKWIKK